MSKIEDKYKPIRIIDINAREIVYYEIIGRPFSRKGEHRYIGTTPYSLDFKQMNYLCRKLKDKLKEKGIYISDKGLVLDTEKKQRTTEAIINVSFADITLAEINKLEPSIKLPENVSDGEKTDGASDKELEEKYTEFVKYYYLNKYNHFPWRVGFIRNDEGEYVDDESEHVKDVDGNDITAFINDNKGTLDDLYSEAEDESAEKKKVEERVRKELIKREIKSFKELIKYYVASEMSSGDILSIRKYIYKNGFDVELSINGDERILRHYKPYKRSASKAKNGDVLFIYEELYDDMMEWTRLGLKVDEKTPIDLTSMKAYEALVMSSIVGEVEIKGDQILMLDSVESKDPIQGNRKIYIGKTVEGKDGKPQLVADLVDEDGYKEEMGRPFEHHNILWDGQALVDKSVFEAAGYGEDNPHAMMLLRNHFFKACALNTNIQQYYKDNDIKHVYDMFGNKILAKKIRMIVTIDSFKLIKFAEYFKDQLKAVDKEDARKKLYELWQKKIKNFGIVKEEKPTQLGHGKYRSVSYQILNTLPLKEENMKKILEKDLDYVKKLRDVSDVSVMCHRLKNTESSARKRFFIYNMLKYEPEFRYHKYYKDFRSKEINEYTNNLRTGRVNIRGDLHVLFSMPMEMLEYSAKEDKEKVLDDMMNNHYLKGNNAYIKGLKEGEDIVLFRYPHINSGSVCVLKQGGNNTYDKTPYFNLSHKTGSNIVIVSPWDSNIMVKLGGADFDSDTAFYIKDETIIKAAKELYNMSFLSVKEDGLPVALADDSLKGEGIKYSYDAESQAELDHNLAKSSKTIGSISNSAQLFNSYFWEEYFKGSDERDEVYLRKVYDCILELSVLNELEIDKSKHSILLDPEQVRRSIMRESYNGEEIIQRKAVTVKKKKAGKIVEETEEYPEYPYFLYLDTKYVKYKALREENKYWDTPVDYISRIIDEIKYNKRTKTITGNLYGYFNFWDDDINYGTLSRLSNELVELIGTIEDVNKNEELDDQKRMELRKSAMDSFWHNKSYETINRKVTSALIRKLYHSYNKSLNETEVEDENPDVKELILSEPAYLALLFEIGDSIEKATGVTNPMLECLDGFWNEDKIVPDLEYVPGKVEVEAGEIELWDDVYKKIKKIPDKS